jgi:hypothetical protein
MPPTPPVYDSTLDYPRDLAGYGRAVPHARWPGGARIALQFVLNYEEGGENAVLHGDPASEQFLSEMFSPAAFPARHMSMEGIYEYGSRAGVWRILREFERRSLPMTIFGVTSWIWRHRRFDGQVIASVLVLYSIWRPINESMRGDEVRGLDYLGLFTTSQLISIPVAVLGVLIILTRVRKGVSPETPFKPEEEHESASAPRF